MNSHTDSTAGPSNPNNLTDQQIHEYPQENSHSKLKNSTK